MNKDIAFVQLDKTLMDLPTLKSYRYGEIDFKTGTLIADGFVYDSKTFSLSANAQSNLLGAYSAKELLTYPVSWNVKDDSETYQIADATEMATFFMTALAAKKAQQNSGTVLKAQITVAVDIPAVNVIIDNR